MSKLYIDRLADLEGLEGLDDDQDVVVKLGLLEKIRSTLEAAKNGLEWYRTMLPSVDSPADDEMMAELDSLLADIDDEPELAPGSGVFEIMLRGFDASGDDTDSLVLWVRAASIDAVREALKDQQYTEGDDLPFSLTAADGVDFDLTQEGQLELLLARVRAS